MVQWPLQFAFFTKQWIQVPPCLWFGAHFSSLLSNTDLYGPSLGVGARLPKRHLAYFIVWAAMGCYCFDLQSSSGI